MHTIKADAADLYFKPYTNFHMDHFCRCSGVSGVQGKLRESKADFLKQRCLAVVVPKAHSTITLELRFGNAQKKRDAKRTVILAIILAIISKLLVLGMISCFWARRELQVTGHEHYKPSADLSNMRQLLARQTS